MRKTDDKGFAIVGSAIIVALAIFMGFGAAVIMQRSSMLHQSKLSGQRIARKSHESLTVTVNRNENTTDVTLRNKGSTPVVAETFLVKDKAGQMHAYEIIDVFSENWEDGDIGDGWVTEGGPFIDSSPHYGSQGEYSIQLRGRDSVTRELDLSGYEDVVISYLESGWSFDGPANYCETARLDFYDGSTWHNDLIHSQEDHFDWRRRDFQVPDSWLSTNSKIRFKFEDHSCDGCCGGDHWWLDNIRVGHEFSELVPVLGTTTFQINQAISKEDTIGVYTRLGNVFWEGR